jgi:hypothetical protein
MARYNTYHKINEKVRSEKKCLAAIYSCSLSLLGYQFTRVLFELKLNAESIVHVIFRLHSSCIHIARV